MTNKEKFVNQFGIDAFNIIRSGNMIDILNWFLDDDCTEIHQIKPEEVKVESDISKLPTVKADDLIAHEVSMNELEQICEEPKPKRKIKGSLVGRGYDLKWYMTAVEDFFLSDARDINYKLKDDLSSAKKCNSMEGLKSRFEVAVKQLELQDSVVVHRLYKNTVNDCVCLEKPDYYKSKSVGFNHVGERTFDYANAKRK